MKGGEVLRDEENVVEEQQRSRIGPGRPKLVRTGAPGRPKKVYNEIPQEEANNTDFVLTCEVPMKQAFSDVNVNFFYTFKCRKKSFTRIG
jgi:hypothetical protein